ncbi:MAG: hypothetical protein H6916_09875 [Novosphingobium sp.]|nr:hypothetical protein [Novosphingobium sp.]MCP5387101.1 hypothetical protein [Novosphingobium sp.]
MNRCALIVPALALSLAGCGGAEGVKTAASRPAPQPPGAQGANPQVVVRPPLRTPPPAAKRQVAPGLEGVIGATVNELTGQFGTARLDVYEGDARKLQFVGSACVLDVFLYPPAPGREPEATYVEARRASDAQDVSDAACIAALRRR